MTRTKTMIITRTSKDVSNALTFDNPSSEFVRVTEVALSCIDGVLAI